MTLKQYNWKDGPDLIQQHSVAKHRILEAYLAAYFRTLVSSPNQEVLKLTLVDGFAGGGLYVHNDTRELVKGSPFIFLDATREAEYLINKDRRKPVQFQVDYFFTEADRHAHLHLDKVLREKGYGDRIGNGIYLQHAKFQDQADSIIEFVKKKSPKNGRSIFALDQYGYREVPAHLMRKIFDALPSAEVILTFGVDSFVNFANDGDRGKDLLDGLGIPDIFGGRSIEEIKSSERDWRLFIQSTLYRKLVENCGARHFTPFFIRNRSGHGDYWLIHLSQHHRARDVMTEVHWANNNYFIHYGGAGLDMFQMVGYDPVHDAAHRGQSALGFEFDDVARHASIATLNEHIPRRVYSDDTGISFGELFATTCNSSPASAQIYRESIGKLLDERVIEVVSADGSRRRSAAQIKATDQIMPPRQRPLLLN
ncbi:three-Cys-motif partner protein TcmP [Variovorax sp. DXTD-1]|uniref:three-Cys-motif partner protein TcmP n=1 Tax=Variovorax sp. DXTD-1 TaxID=2495592 RepID=UPI000F865E04|nr:three-Cys-motif partner protein TcmP [Variovorax sp. DXTD-1]RST47112.1 three-Cys-motif partner protein TcmP [Variovorax sp. DXTD-1]